MTYFPHSEKEIKEMLDKTGLKDLNDLKRPIPEKFHIKSLNINKSKNELELLEYFKTLCSKNREYSSIFMGAGAYYHYIPAAVDEIMTREEFYTAYTPYQAEVSQGTLQTIFEYQTYIAELTGLDIANASMYDGATSLAESVLMTCRITNKNKVLIDKYVHPEYLEVLTTYLKPLNIEIRIFECSPYKFDAASFKKTWNDELSCFAFASPNYFGTINDIGSISEIIHNSRSLLIHCITEPLSLAVLRTPFENGADIACGETQSFGIPLSFGGPYNGFISCRKELMRKLPGRIAGQTTDKDGTIVYVLTLSTREQHIRRENATSNICSNHSLCALRTAVYLSLLGKKGLRECALKNIENSHQLFNKISSLKKFRINKTQFFFNEFTVQTEIDYKKIKSSLEEENILSFKPLKDDYDDYSGTYLVSSTEMNKNEDINKFIKLLESL